MLFIKKYLGLIIIFIGVFLIMVWFFYWLSVHRPSSQNPSPPTVSTVASSTTLIEASSTRGLKSYTNIEYGFEFWYPDTWKIQEGHDINPSIPLAVNAFPVGADGTYPNFNPLEVTVTTQERMNHFLYSIRDRGILSRVVVSGTEVTRYDYIGETIYSSVVIPRADYVMFITNSNKENLTEFNQILASFKFLK